MSISKPNSESLSASPPSQPLLPQGQPVVWRIDWPTGAQRVDLFQYGKSGQGCWHHLTLYLMIRH
jgi:hypothetical protein